MFQDLKGEIWYSPPRRTGSKTKDPSSFENKGESKTTVGVGTWGGGLDQKLHKRVTPKRKKTVGVYIKKPQKD